MRNTKPATGKHVRKLTWTERRRLDNAARRHNREHLHQIMAELANLTEPDHEGEQV